MQQEGMPVAKVTVGSPGASTSSAEFPSGTGKGAGAASVVEGTLFHSRGGVLASGGQSLASVGDMAASVLQSSVPQAVASTSGFQGAVTTSRQRFHIELKEGETNVVSWKKLVKDSQKNAAPVAPDAPAGANPALEARFAPELGGLGQTNVGVKKEPPNRFSSVIERIERLYKGVDSEDEEDPNINSDESQYDSQDDFIDDSELNEYFSVGKARTKFQGFFVNRGKLEKVIVQPPPPPVHVPKKRKRNSLKLSSEIVAGEFAKKRVNIGLRLKDAARKTAGPNTLGGDPGPSILNVSEHSSVAKPQKRLKPVPDDRDADGLNLVPGCNHALKEGIRDASKAGDLKEADKKLQSAKVEPSDDENDLQTVLRPQPIVKDGGSSDARISSRQIPKPSEGHEVAHEEKFISSKSSKPYAEPKVAADEMRGTENNAVKKIQSLAKDGEAMEAEGSVKSSPKSLVSLQGTKEVSPKRTAGWPKGTVLERAINDFAKGVAEAFPFTGDRQEAIEKAEAGGKSKRLPREIKQKLAKVARLAAKKGKIQDELIDRLMNIIGHVMRLKSLKRNLKAMVEMGLNAKQEKDVQWQNMKREVREHLKRRVAISEALLKEQDEKMPDDAPLDATMDPGPSHRFSWDVETEDRICNLYDHYVEGMDEHKGPQIRKLYLELQELWPPRWMETQQIKLAVTRAMFRRKAQNKPRRNQLGEKRRKANLATVKQKVDRDSPVKERPLAATESSFAVVSPVVKLPPPKEKLTVKSSKQRVDGASKQRDDQNKLDSESQQMHYEGARLAMEAVRHGSSHRDLSHSATTKGGQRESHLSTMRAVVKTEESKRAVRIDDRVKASISRPQKPLEGNSVERVAKMKSKKLESVDNDTLESMRRHKKSRLDVPLVTTKAKKLNFDGKSSPSSKTSSTTLKASSKADMIVKSSIPSKHRQSGSSSSKHSEEGSKKRSLKLSR